MFANVKEKINNVTKNFVDSEIQQIAITVAKFNPDMSAEEYTKTRIELNAHIIQATLGAEIVQKKDGSSKMKFHHAIPTAAQLAEIIAWTEEFCDKFEAEYVQSLGASAGDDDISVVPVGIGVGKVPDLEKVNRKKLVETMINENGSGAINIALTPADVAKIYELGEKARKDHNFKLTLVIGGTVLVAVGGCILYKKYEDKKSAETEEVPEIEVDDDTDIDDDDIDDYDDDMDDLDEEGGSDVDIDIE